MAVRFGEFIFRADTRQLSRRGAEVHLSPKAFQLLESLISKRPAAVSKQDLYRSLWGEIFVEEANLPNLIHEIRAALSHSHAAIIRTVPRFGYAFAAEVSDSGHSPGSTFCLAVGDQKFDLPPGETIVGRDPRAAPATAPARDFPQTRETPGRSG